MTTDGRLPRLDNGRQPNPDPPPVYCTIGETLCRVHVWTDEEWARLAALDRPLTAEHFPGLGWVGAVPARGPR